VSSLEELEQAAKQDRLKSELGEAQLQRSKLELTRIMPAGDFRRGCELVSNLSLVAQAPKGTPLVQEIILNSLCILQMSSTMVRPVPIADMTVRNPQSRTSRRKVLKHDQIARGAAQEIDRFSMSFFQPPRLNTLEPYQLEFLENIFEQVWSQIVPRHYPLSPDLRQHLQTDISTRLCSFVARGVMEPTVLLGLTVATVKSPRRRVRRRVRVATPHPVGG
jgi:hypothetical protein